MTMCPTKSVLFSSLWNLSYVSKSQTPFAKHSSYNVTIGVFPYFVFWRWLFHLFPGAWIYFLVKEPLLKTFPFKFKRTSVLWVKYSNSVIDFEFLQTDWTCVTFLSFQCGNVKWKWVSWNTFWNSRMPFMDHLVWSEKFSPGRDGSLWFLS